MMVLRALRGEGSKYVSSSFFVCLKAGQKKEKNQKEKNKKTPTNPVHQLPVVSCSQVLTFSSVIPHGMKVVFIFHFL